METDWKLPIRTKKTEKSFLYIYIEKENTVRSLSWTSYNSYEFKFNKTFSEEIRATKQKFPMEKNYLLWLNQIILLEKDICIDYKDSTKPNGPPKTWKATIDSHKN